MRRIFLLLLCLLLLTTAVQAAESVTNMESSAVVAENGTCRMSVAFTLTVENGSEELYFPLPGGAKDISLNGTGAKTFRRDGLRWVDLSPVVYGPGTYSLNLHYSLPDLVTKVGKSGLQLELPLLSGFAYPIDRMSFSVTLPGKPQTRPVFTSTYHPESTESFLQYSIADSVISGQFSQGLKDHETLLMTLSVTEEMFPQNLVKVWSLSYDDLLQYGLLLLAILYWVFFLRCPLPRRFRRLQAPDGITAGELGCCLSGLGVDFPLMVLSWARLGYLSIELDRYHRILLHKNMDMDNERSSFEVHCFKSLFGRRLTVDAGSEHFARLSRKASKAVPVAAHYFNKKSGNTLIFRCLTTAIGAVAGYSLAIAFAYDTVWQVVLSVFLIPLGTALSWTIQDGVRGTLLRHRLDLLLGIFSCLVWLGLGIWAGEAGVAIFVVLIQVLSGFAAAHSGRRTEGGVQARNEILGLRKYLRTVTAEEVRPITEHNPDYYFDLLPDAIALGVDKHFAKQFKEQKMPVCPYLQVAGGTATTAKEWAQYLQQVVRQMDATRQKMRWKRIFNR
ncbi:MAG: DUF2207 domain-containing protein [Ruminococcaceae bacterium]|nr:DUF2207 domain-containing protein [Oscillospiraceae bacterium]